MKSLSLGILKSYCFTALNHISQGGGVRVLKAKKMLFVCVDIQERKVLELMAHKESVVKNANILLQATQILQAPLFKF